MSNLFKKAAVFTDIHFGLKSNSQVHNEDCLNFIKWATATAKENGCETAFFLGDWHNNRASINIITLNYSLQALEHLNANFDKVYFIPGNHDLYYRDKRDIQSVEWAKHLPNVQICNDWFSDGDVVIAPAGDDDRGMMILEWGKEPTFHAWPDQPKYRVYGLKDVLTHTEAMLQPGMHVRVNLDVDISYEEATFIKENFVSNFGLREIVLVPSKKSEFGEENINIGDIKFESVDQIVTDQIVNINSESFDPNLLLQIYQTL